MIPAWPTNHAQILAILALLGGSALILAHRYIRWPSVRAARLWGGLIFGAPSIALAPIGPPEPRVALAFLGLVALVILPIVILAARSPKHWEAYPLDRRERWDRRGELENAAAWGVYLVGYELFFRGLMLSVPAAAFGAWPALAIMTAVYVAQHLPRPASEAIGTLPMGLVFGLVTLASGSVWPAFLGHWAIAVASDAAAIRFSGRGAR